MLAHELGHAFTGRAFGLQPAITLHGMGGVTTWVSGRNLSAGRSLLISLAGPAVGLFVGVVLLLAGLGVAILAPHYQPPALASQLFEAAVYVNIIWSLFNLCAHHAARRRQRDALVLGAHQDRRRRARGARHLDPVAAAVGIWLLRTLYAPPDDALHQPERGRHPPPSLDRGGREIQRELLERYPGWLAGKDGESMIREGTRARAAAKTPHLVAYATEIVAMGQCLTGDARAALATLGAMPRGFARASTWRSTSSTRPASTPRLSTSCAGRPSHRQSGHQAPARRASGVVTMGGSAPQTPEHSLRSLGSLSLLPPNPLPSRKRATANQTRSRNVDFPE